MIRSVGSNGVESEVFGSGLGVTPVGTGVGVAVIPVVGDRTAVGEAEVVGEGVGEGASGARAATDLIRTEQLLDPK